MLWWVCDNCAFSDIYECSSQPDLVIVYRKQLLRIDSAGDSPFFAVTLSSSVAPRGVGTLDEAITAQGGAVLLQVEVCVYGVLSMCCIVSVLGMRCGVVLT